MRKPFTPFLGDQPDSRIALCFYGDSTGLRYWNNKKDPMPIQGLDMSKGLEHYCVEHVEGVYKIYSDGEIQTVMGYAGLGDLYNEAMKTIYEEEITRGVDIQSRTHITSNIEFHRMLVEQLNQDNIAKVEIEQAQLLSSRNILEEEVQPLVMSEQRVITSINFCCRVDLEDGSIYIGEGYENIWNNTIEKTIFTNRPELVETKIDNKYFINGTTTGSMWINFSKYGINIPIKTGEEYCINHNFKFKLSESLKSKIIDVSTSGGVGFANISCDSSIIDKKDIWSWTTTNQKFRVNQNASYLGNMCFPNIYINANPNTVTFNETDWIEIIQMQTTITNKQVPFVQSHMPSGKLTFITNATSGTHSFIGNKFISTFSSDGRSFLFGQTSQGIINSETFITNKDNMSPILSKEYNNASSIFSKGLSTGLLTLRPRHGSLGQTLNSFSQLLIYENDERGGMTQAELEGELAKDIKLK